MIEKLAKIDDITKYIPRDVSDKTSVKPSYWELQNRKAFYQWLEEQYGKYNQGNSKQRELIAKEEIQPNKDRAIKQLAPIQRLVRDFLQGASPYRGLLIYYGLGVGKTQTAISIANAIENRDEVIFLSKAALEPNFINGIKKGGIDYMVNNNYWVFCKRSDSEEFQKLAKEIGVQQSVINELGGLYLIDYSRKESNYNELTTKESDELNKQIESLIRKRFKFMHYDDTRLIRKLEEREYSFDNKVIIMEEVHNLINGMTKTNTSAARLYKMLLDAKGSKFICLTATPIVNKVFEAAKLFNLLRGKIYYSEFKLKFVFAADVDYRKIKQELLKDRQIDQVVINKINKTIKITFNPHGYLTSTSPDKKGVIAAHGSPAIKSREEITKEAERVLTKLGYKFNISTGYETALPEEEDEFNQYFYNPDLNKIKKKELFKKRIANLTSFYDYKDPELFPRNKGTTLVRTPMSDYQLAKYEVIRGQEIKEERRNAMNRGKEEEKMSSSYRLGSRLACSFVEPRDIPSISEFRKNEEVRGELLEKIKDEFEEADELDSKVMDDYFKKYVLKKLESKKEEYFSTESLKEISPKYLSILKNIASSNGNILIYSYFISFIGLKTLSLAMEATGKWEELKIRKIEGEWQLSSDMKESNKKEKNRYVFFSGKQSSEEKPIIQAIYNSQYDQLPNNCQKLRKQLIDMYGPENIRGAAVKCLMTTKSGAEGLDLKNVRDVHICEPFWHPVLIEQVIGRAVRTNSHIALPIEERDVRVFVYMATIPKQKYNNIVQAEVRRDYARYNDGLDMKGQIATSDEYLYITSERKRAITQELLGMIKDTAFDCNLNYRNNKRQHPDIVCMDYETKDRNEYLFTPHLDDTLDIINIKQDYYVTTNYTKFRFAGKEYYFNTEATTDGQYFIYDEAVIEQTRQPKPIGKMILRNGKMTPAFYKSALRNKAKSVKTHKNSSKRKSKTMKLNK
jgi:superfamily II DNA or RNA helicase